MKFQRLAMIVLAAAVLATACRNTEAKDVEAKKKELAKQKTKLKEVNSEIEKLEKEIARMDTSFHIEQKSKLVEITPIVKQDFKHYIEVQGNVDAEENVTALNQQPGVVTAIFVKVGDHVNKGQVLATTVNEGAFQDQLTAAQTNLTLATTAFEKQKTLWDQKIGSEIQYLQAKAQKESAEKNIDALKKQVENTKVIAPISGTVDAVNLRVGDMAAPSQLMPGIRIINGQSLKVKAKLADSDFGKVKEGDHVQIEFPDIHKVVDATINYVSRTIDPRSRTFSVDIKLNNDNNIYAANMIAKLKINDEEFKNVILVPSNVIQRSIDGYYVLIAEEAGSAKTARKKMVTPGAAYAGRTVITDGLAEGDKVITFGYTEVVDAQKIEYK